MTPATLKEAIQEAERFLKAAKAIKVISRSEDGPNGDYKYVEMGNPVVNGAAKRASMDLTRALARLRHS